METRHEPVGSHPGDNSDAAIVSAFGRGNWLALELAHRGWRVTLIDASDAISGGRSDDALIDGEGPFGFFEAEDVAPSFITRLMNEGGLLPVDNGFALWLADGPAETRMKMTDARFRGLGLSEACLRYAKRSTYDDKNADRERRMLAREPFRESWLAHFAHVLASTEHEENHRGLDLECTSPLFARFSIRQVSLQSHQEGLAKCMENGVTVRRQAVVRDLRLEGSSVDALEIGDERAGIERARSFVWTLSSAETELFPQSLFKALFPGGAAAPAWYWQRFRFQLDGDRSDDAIPAYAVMIEDVCLPWTHENVLVLRRRSEPRAFDIWAKLPMHARQDEKYLAEVAASVQSRFRRRVPLYEPRLVALPRIGGDSPPRMPVFTDSELGEIERLRAPNFFYCGPELWASLDWLGQARAQKLILAKLDKLKAQWDANARKLAAKEASP